MKPSPARRFWMGWLLLSVGLGLATAGAEPANPRLSKKQDAFFIENDFVYRRFLLLARDGSYRQINRERSAAEVDRGTWTQDADGAVLLHFTRGGLRFHALLSGPLSVLLDDPPSANSLSAVADAIRAWLARSSNAVFAAASVTEIAVPPGVLHLDPGAESVSRADFESLARQIDDFAWSEQQQTYRLTFLKPANSPALLIPRGAVFQAEDLPRVQREYRIGRRQPPPFYFAQVDAATFAREAANWQPLP